MTPRDDARETLENFRDSFARISDVVGRVLAEGELDETSRRRLAWLYRQTSQVTADCAATAEAI